jgi:hypothetical protein
MEGHPIAVERVEPGLGLEAERVVVVVIDVTRPRGGS